MNEPKRRGRPPKTAAEQIATVPASDMAQAYALRVWQGQSESLPRSHRVARVKAALEGQGMTMEGVELP